MKDKKSDFDSENMSKIFGVSPENISCNNHPEINGLKVLTISGIYFPTAPDAIAACINRYVYDAHDSRGSYFDYQFDCRDKAFVCRANSKVNVCLSYKTKKEANEIASKLSENFEKIQVCKTSPDVGRMLDDYDFDKAVSVVDSHQLQSLAL